ncbi:hypothetical protein BDQ12DRAFT_667703 [Crucibulum laeve]|uniref:Uncharacterized protein n=1 Tax=Crucibulum laeve TaxID=68775 RepID=A0A5C3M5Y4_9AGAR|nr:hypothetical protein BDQ12DRAFT_667703 [Crucibulum laeve]
MLKEDEVLTQLASETHFESKVEAEGKFIIPKNIGRVIKSTGKGVNITPKYFHPWFIPEDTESEDNRNAELSSTWEVGNSKIKEFVVFDLTWFKNIFQNITGSSSLNIDDFLPPLNAQVEAEQFCKAVINSLNLRKDNYIHTSWGTRSSHLHLSTTLGAVIIDEEVTETGETKNTSDKGNPDGEGKPLGDKSSNDDKPTKPESHKVKKEEIDPDLDAKPKDKDKGVDPKEKGKHYKEFKEKNECEGENKKEQHDSQKP